MGAESFSTTGQGETVEQAFRRAVENAAYEYGHGGYTGTIAEKQEYVLIEIPPEWVGRPADYAEHLIDKGDARIDDKWGPAGALQLETDTWLFFGWASS